MIIIALNSLLFVNICVAIKLPVQQWAYGKKYDVHVLRIHNAFLLDTCDGSLQVIN